MIIDTFTRIATGKEVCEDYIKSGEKYVILADGCSSSIDTDFGSRVMVNLAEKYFRISSMLNEVSDEIEKYHLIGNRTIVSANLVTSFFGRGNEWLDTTLSIMFYEDGFINIFMYGDGFIILKDKNKKITHLEVEFRNNAPFYLSYLLDNIRAKNYVEQFDAATKISCSNKNFGSGIISESYIIPPLDSWLSYSIPLYFRFPKDEYEIVMIASDGISPNTFHGIDFNNFLETITDFKNPVGKVLQRSCKREFERLTKNGIVNYDDVTIGVFFNPD